VTEGTKLLRYLTPPEAADLTRLSVTTILRAIRRGHLVAARVGNRVRIHPDALRAWLERAEGGRP
jgi:excisionase family DNA binding protein